MQLNEEESDQPRKQGSVDDRVKLMQVYILQPMFSYFIQQLLNDVHPIVWNVYNKVSE